MKISNLIIIFIICPSLVIAGDYSIQMEPIVSTTSGRLIGQKTLINNNDEIYQFFGVPYAQPPIGVNRFERPKELLANTSERLLMAKQLKPTCMQMKHLAKAINPLLDLDQIHNVCIENDELNSNFKLILFLDFRRLSLFEYLCSSSGTTRFSITSNGMATR